MYPPDADSRTQRVAVRVVSKGVYNADDFVAWNHRQAGRWCASLDFVELGVANAARDHANAYLPAAGLGYREVGKDQRRWIVVE